MKKLFALVLLACPLIVFSQNTLKLNGSIGTYDIEVELTPNSDSSQPILGKYRYKGKTAYLNLKGKLYSSSILYLEESYDGKTTGEFFLEHEEGNWMGRWTNGKKAYEVDLQAIGGNLQDFKTLKEDEIEEGTNNEIAGTYSSNLYFINDYFFSEENPSIEIGYNGGTVSVTEMNSDSLWIELQTVSGPTYHIAYFERAVVKTEKNTYVYNDIISEYSDDEVCHLKFIFENEGILYVEQLSTNMACDFGMRAYAGGDYKKFTNESKEIEK